MSANKRNIRVLNKLFDNGFTTEKAITTLSARDMVQISGITVVEMAEIIRLQDAIKDGKVISYLSGELEKGKESEETEHV